MSQVPSDIMRHVLKGIRTFSKQTRKIEWRGESC